MAYSPFFDAPGVIPSDGFSSDEQLMLLKLIQDQALHYSHNILAKEYYESKHNPSLYGLSVPPIMKLMNINLGWCAKVVDTVEARLDFEGWASADDSNPDGLQDIYDDNYLDLISHQAHLDALIYGCSFIVVGTGDTNGPDPLITVASPMNMTAEWNEFTRSITGACNIYSDNNEQVATLYLPNSTLKFGRDLNTPFHLISRDDHNLGQVPVVVVANKPTSEQPFGHSELTRAIRSAQDEGVRTTLNMAVAGEFYAAPQRYVLGADESAFLNADGTPTDKWKLIQGRMLTLTGETDSAQLPQVGQFAAASPAPYLSIIQQKAKEVASYANLPVRYFDENTNAPTSADAIRADEAALVKAAERKQKQFGRAWNQVGQLALMVRDGKTSKLPTGVKPQWKSAQTPTLAANTDAVAKLIATGVVGARNPVVLDIIDLDNNMKAKIIAGWDDEETFTPGQLQERATITDAATSVPTDEDPNAQITAPTIAPNQSAVPNQS